MSSAAGPDISEQGLSLYVDAGNPLSYSGSGTSWFDLSGNVNTGTLTNTPSFNRSNLGVINFNGSNQFVNFGNVLNVTTNSFSVECWFNRTANSTSNTFGGALIAKDAYGPNNGWAMFVNNSDYGGGVCGFQTRVSNVVYGANSTFAIQNNVWYHLVGVRDTVNKTNYLYINGVLNGSAAENPTVNPTNSTATVIGNVGGQSRHFNGLISNVKVYNRTLTSTEILQNFNATRSRFGI